MIHEKEIKRLKKELEDKDDLLEKIRTYFGICEEEKALAEAESDQSRLLSRGPRDPGRLLREEQMRKRVKGKPKVRVQAICSYIVWVINCPYVARTATIDLSARMGEED